MAERRSLFSPTTERGSLVSGGDFSPPLLPYEKQLIAVLDISEQEYRVRLRELYRNANRPPGYESIPDIRCDPVSIIVSVAIGAVLTGISMLLMPKPKVPENQKRDRLELPNESGRSRFNQTRGFQGAPPLATLGARIPYIFGNNDVIPSMEGNEGETVETGGIVAEPVLLWSRMESNTSFQTFKLLMSIGLGMMDEQIKAENVMIAGKSLSSYFESNVLLHHRRYGGTVERSDAIYGDVKVTGGGKFEDLPYGCPSGESFYGSTNAFCQAYSPSSSTNFGVSRAIRNGTRFSLNWEVISIPDLKDQADDKNKTLRTKRKKIAGANGDGKRSGMPGTGRWYNPLVGIVRFEGASGTESSEFQTMRAKIGDELVYSCGRYIYDNVAEVDLEQSSGDQTINIGDLNSAINTLRQEADNLMQEGEVLLMGDVLLQVTDRPKDIWLEGKRTDYRLKVVGFNGDNNRVGIAGQRIVLATGSNKDYLVSHEGGDGIYRAKGTQWYPLMKVDYALANNTRACDVTEIGLRSKIYNQANGLCNFPVVPSPNQLQDIEDEGTSISNPTQTKYMYRTGFFQIYVRELSADNSGNFEGYEPLNPIFAVSGNEPIDIFNWIRIIHPRSNSYSFKFFPITAQVMQDKGVATIYSLNANADTRTEETSCSAGTFQVIFRASVQSKDELSNLPELRAKHKGFDEVGLEYSGVSYNGGSGTGDPAAIWAENQAFFESQLDQLAPTRYSNFSERVGSRQSAEFTARKTYSSGTVTARIRVTSTVISTSEGSKRAFGIAKKWQVGGASFDLLDLNLPSGFEKDGPQDFEVEIDETGLDRKTFHASPDCALNNAFSKRTYKFMITGGRVVNKGNAPDFEREWDSNTRVKEVPTYTEISNSSQQGPEHSIAYINEIVTNPTAPSYESLDLLGLQMRSMNSNLSVSQVSVYKKEGIIVERLNRGNRDPGDVAFGPSSNFAEILHWLLVHPTYGIGQEINSRKVSGSGREVQYRSPLVDTDSFVQSAKFLKKLPLRFDGALATEVNLRMWATEQAQAFMCNLVMKNGVFYLQPALPVTKDGDIERNITIKALFTAGNILEESFNLEYLPLSDRRPFEAVIRFREMRENTLANERTVLVRYAADDDNNLPQEDYDYTSFCTSYEHAVTSAKYLLSLRRRVDHVVSFQTIPQGLQIAPGDYIKVQTDLNPYTNVRSGSIDASGAIKSVHSIEDGTHQISVYVKGSDVVANKTMTVKDLKVLESELYESLFALPNIQNNFGVYMVEEINIDENGVVDVKASNVATTGGVGNDLGSKMVQDIQDDSRWTVKTS